MESEDTDFESEDDDESDSEPEIPAKRPQSRNEGIEGRRASLPEERWKGTDEEDIAPEQLPFEPARTPGAQLSHEESYSPLQLFQLFFTASILETVVKNTNKVGKAEHDTKWRDITVRDMYSYLCMLIFMGLLKLRTLADYWRRDELCSFPFPCSVMSGKKFHSIAAAIHLSDPEDDAANSEKKGTPDYDRLGKIKPIYEELRKACKAIYHPKQNIAVDERMVKSKARTMLKQYMKNKPTKWGFKLFVLADSANGYTWDFTVYQGKAQHRTKNGLGYDTVMDLVSPSTLGTGYRLYVDNFYTSPTLFHDLLEMKIMACGTLRLKYFGSLKLKLGQLDRRFEV